MPKDDSKGFGNNSDKLGGFGNSGNGRSNNAGSGNENPSNVQNSKDGMNGDVNRGSSSNLDKLSKNSSKDQSQRLGHGFGSGDQSGLNDIAKNSDKSGLKDLAGDKAKESFNEGIKDPNDPKSDDDQDKQDGDSDDLGVNNDDSSNSPNLGKEVNNGQALPKGLQGLADKLPNPVKKAGGKVGELYGKGNDKAVKGVMKIGSKFGIGNQLAQGIVHMLLAGVIGFGGFGIIHAYDNQNTLDSHFVCATTNDSDNEYMGDGDLTTEGTTGAWTKKGTKSYEYAKESYQTALDYFGQVKQAAAVVGNGVGESNYKEQYRYGGGGFYQFNNMPSDMTPKGQTLEIIKEGGHPFHQPLKPAYLGINGKPNVYTDEFKKMTGSLAYLTNTFLISFESAGTPRADVRMAAAHKALEVFQNLTPAVSFELTDADNNTATAEQYNNITCNTSGFGDQADGNIVTNAKKFLHKIPYSQGYRMSINTKSISGNADCSSFVWAMFGMSGFKVPDSAWNTVTMVDGTMSKYIKTVPAYQARAGDAFVINIGASGGDNGHTGILLENWHGNNTMIINEGGSQGNVNISTFGEACYPALNGGTIKFVRPIQPTSTPFNH